MIENYFVDKLNPEKCTSTYIFDSFPFDEKDKDGKDRYFLSKFLKKIQLPTFVINLVVSKENITKRYKTQKEMEPEAELDEENQLRLAECIAKGEKVREFWEDQQKSYGINVYNTVADNSLETTKKLVNTALYKRVICVSDYTDINNVQVLLYYITLRNKRTIKIFS